MNSVRSIQVVAQLYYGNQADPSNANCGVSTIDLLFDHKGEEAFSYIMAVIESIKPGNSCAYIHFINAYNYEQDALNGINIGISFVRAGGEVFAKCCSIANLESALRWKSESIELYFLPDHFTNDIVQERLDFKTRWWKYDTFRNSRHILDSVNVSDPYIIYSQNHYALQIIGSAGRILSTFDSIRKCI